MNVVTQFGTSNWCRNLNLKKDKNNCTNSFLLSLLVNLDSRGVVLLKPCRKKDICVYYTFLSYCLVFSNASWLFAAYSCYGCKTATYYCDSGNGEFWSNQVDHGNKIKAPR